MNLIKADNGINGPTSQVQVRCIVCEKWHPISTMLVDLDGPAFVAYYCRNCAVHDEQIQRALHKEEG